MTVSTDTATKTYRITALKVDEEFIAKCVDLVVEEGLSLSKAAKELETSAGRVAMSLLLHDTPIVAYADKDDLAKQVVAARVSGDAWGLLAARYRVTEGTCRSAFGYGSAGVPFFAIDYRGWTSMEESPVEVKRAHAKTKAPVVVPEGANVEARGAAKRKAAGVAAKAKAAAGKRERKSSSPATAAKPSRARNAKVK